MALPPRAVVVSRPSELDELLARHGTRGAAEFFLRERGRDLDELEARHEALTAALIRVGAAVPDGWRRGAVTRADLDRFLFGPEDVVVVVGQDGLVANVAKYLDGQPVIGITPDPAGGPRVLTTHPASAAGDLMRAAARPDAPAQRRAMVRCTLDDGQSLDALNELFVGHASHQSARYLLVDPSGESEHHSSSGVIVGTGTGATGWCASIAHDRAVSGAPRALPRSEDSWLSWFAREAWPSRATGTTLTAGRVDAGRTLEIVAESDTLVVFGDGVENDHLSVSWGQRLRIGVSPRRLRVVTG